MPTLYAIDWFEVRNSWRNIRGPVKTTYHLTIEDARKYIVEDYWSSVPPDFSYEFYLIPERPYKCEVSQDFYENFKKGKRNES